MLLPLRLKLQSGENTTNTISTRNGKNKKENKREKAAKRSGGNKEAKNEHQYFGGGEFCDIMDDTYLTKYPHVTPVFQGSLPPQPLVWVNIRGITSVEDSYYRYRMPIMTIHLRRKGEGKSSTTLPNICQVARSLFRDPSEIMKYFGCELGAMTLVDYNKNYFAIKGIHDEMLLQELLYKYIENFVICESCRLPEAHYKVKHGALSLRCYACGHKKTFQTSNRFTGFIVKNMSSAKGEIKTKKSKEPRQLIVDCIDTKVVKEEEQKSGLVNDYQISNEENVGVDFDLLSLVVDEKVLRVSEKIEDDELKESSQCVEPLEKEEDSDKEEGEGDKEEWCEVVCPVCLDTAADTQLPCGHEFCETCITTWSLQQRQRQSSLCWCPLCRHAFTPFSQQAVKLGYSFK